MSISLITSTADPAFRVACDHRHALVREVDGRDLDAFSPGWRERYDLYHEGVFARGDGAFLTYEIDGIIAGSCIVSELDEYRSSTFGRGTAYVNAMYVLEAYRGRAIAAQLLDAAIAWGRARNCRNVRLHPSPKSRDFYAKHGFTPIDEYERRI